MLHPPCAHIFTVLSAQLIPHVCIVGSNRVQANAKKKTPAYVKPEHVDKFEQDKVTLGNAPITVMHVADNTANIDSIAGDVLSNYPAEDSDHFVVVITTPADGQTNIAFGFKGCAGMKVVSRDDFVARQVERGMVETAAFFRSLAFDSLALKLAEKTPKLLEVVPSGTPHFDHAIVKDVFEDAVWDTVDGPTKADIMASTHLKTVDDTALRVVVNQMEPGDATETPHRHLCQRTMQSAKNATAGSITFLLDIPRPPASVRQALHERT